MLEIATMLVVPEAIRSLFAAVTPVSLEPSPIKRVALTISETSRVTVGVMPKPTRPPLVR